MQVTLGRVDQHMNPELSHSSCVQDQMCPKKADSMSIQMCPAKDDSSLKGVAESQNLQNRCAC